MITLEPCPFCHSMSQRIQTRVGESVAFVQCITCGAIGPIRPSRYIPTGISFDTIAKHEWNVWALAHTKEHGV